MIINKKLILAALIIVVAIEGAALISRNSPASLEVYADKAIEACKDAGYRPSCYDKEIPKFTDKLSMEDAFRVTGIVQDKDPSYQYCHVLGHELSAREVRKNPDDWKNVIARCPSGMCSNGCLHGGFQEKFRAEYLTPEEIPAIKRDLIDLCEAREGWNPTGLEQASCYHALGHLTMYITNADIPQAIKICDETSFKPDGRDLRQLCYDGVFMQMFQPLEPEDFALVEGKQPTREEVPAFCAAYEGHKQASCFSESWPLFQNDLMNPKNVTGFCEMTEAAYRGRCYNAVFYVMTTRLGFDVDTLSAYCQELPADIRETCFANAASRMIETDYRNVKKSADLCRKAAEFGAEERCFKELLQYSTFNFHVGSEAFFNLCNSLPEPWQSQCLSKTTR